MSEPRAIKIAIAAMGGQGGGVLANWIVRLGEENGFIAQATSVPGVAQRTGATVYYVELFPMDAVKAAGKDPVLALMPSPGDVDIVIAAELMEAGRAVKRGIVTKQTTLIASTHRDYAISEKIGLGDARQDGDRVLGAARAAAGVFIGADMAEAAAKAGTVISAVLFGALAGCGALPIAKARYEDVIRASGRAVDANLRGFASGVEIARNGVTSAPDRVGVDRRPSTPAPAVAPLIERMQSTFPAGAHFYIREGLKRTVDFQDVRYAEEYLDRLRNIPA
ncbi:MAG: indolepyruvate oxidoreductase subunit beta family protein [Parvularculaceae bacterium]